MASKQCKAKAGEVGGIVERIPENQEFQSRDKGVRIGVSIGTDAEVHDLPLGQEDPFVEGGVSGGVISSGVDHAPEGPIEDLVKYRGRRVVVAVDSTVEVGGAHQVLCAAVHGNIVAVLLDLAREGAKGLQSGDENRGGEGSGRARRDEARIGEPCAVIELGRRLGPAVYEQASGLGEGEGEEEEKEKEKEKEKEGHGGGNGWNEENE